MSAADADVPGELRREGAARFAGVACAGEVSELTTIGEVSGDWPPAALGGPGLLSTSPQRRSEGAGTTLSGGSGISILGYVFTVIILAVAAAVVLFRGGFLGVFSGPSKAERKLHIEESRSLGHRQHLVVASYEGRRFLLGVCPGSIEYLSGLDTEGLTPSGSFQELLAAAPKAAGDKTEPQKDAP